MTEHLTSRQRVLAALAHREPDRVPVSFGDICFSTIFDYPPNGYRALCEALGITDYAAPVSSPDDGGCVLNIDERLMIRLGADLRTVASGSSYEWVYLPDGASVDAWGLVRHRVGPYWELDDRQAPLRDARTMADVDAWWDPPDPADPAIWMGKREEAQAIRDAGYAVLAVGGTALQVGHNYAFTRGFEPFLTDMVENPRFWHGYAERLTDWAIEYMTAFLRPIADLVDIVQFTDDLGTQRSLFMSPDQYRAFLKPYHRRWMEAMHRLVPGAKIAIHTCGSVYRIIPDLIEIGIEILNPIQPRARDMEPWRLKQEFGRDLSFLGGVDIQELLPRGSEREVRAAVGELIEVLGAGGGFILAPSHQFQPDVPPANIVAMYDTALRDGSTPFDAGGASGRDASRQPRSNSGTRLS
jgi:uroporphyrinogen decarboxylase